MKITFERNGRRLLCDTVDGKSIAINMDFDGSQPNHFGTEKANRHSLQLGGFLGDTARGGSCNVDVLSMIPHCNGTHTETIAHIVDESVFVGQAAPGGILRAQLITITPQPADSKSGSYRPRLESGDRLLTAESLRAAWEACGNPEDIEALVIQTEPNELSKMSRTYDEDHQPPFFSVEAMSFVNEIGIRHLLVDIPSVDRMYDEGLLTNHHLFWNVAEQTHRLSAESWRDKTITEMVFVPDSMDDGFYLLSLQVPAFYSDAAPSRPILYPVKEA